MTIDERIAWAKKQRNIAYKKDSVQGIVYWDGYLAALKAVKEDVDQRKHEQKQIEFERNEIAEIIANSFDHNGEKWDASDFEWSACQVQNADYRKASEVASEVIDDISNFLESRNGVGYVAIGIVELKHRLYELKKKYTEGEG